MARSLKSTLAPLQLDNFQRLVSPVLIGMDNPTRLPEKLPGCHRGCTACAIGERAIGQENMGVGQIVSVLTGFLPRGQANAIDAGVGLLLIKGKACLLYTSDAADE